MTRRRGWNHRITLNTVKVDNIQNGERSTGVRERAEYVFSKLCNIGVQKCFHSGITAKHSAQFPASHAVADTRHVKTFVRLSLTAPRCSRITHLRTCLCFMTSAITPISSYIDVTLCLTELNLQIRTSKTPCRT